MRDANLNKCLKCGEITVAHTMEDTEKPCPVCESTMQQCLVFTAEELKKQEFKLDAAKHQAEYYKKQLEDAEKARDRYIERIHSLEEALEDANAELAMLNPNCPHQQLKACGWTKE